MNYSIDSDIYEQMGDHASEPVLPSGASVAEWRFAMDVGNKAFADGKLNTAANHYQRATRVAEDLLRLSQDGGIDPNCAARAVFESRRNLAEILLRLGQRDQAVDALEMGFMKFCVGAAWPCGAQPVRNACAHKIAESLEALVIMMERLETAPSKIISVYDTAEAAQSQWRKLDETTPAPA
ncbi:MAG: hypothetical protein AAGC77_04015 [Pseudomonadota bacterium]